MVKNYHSMMYIYIIEYDTMTGMGSLHSLEMSQVRPPQPATGSIGTNRKMCPYENNSKGLNLGENSRPFAF